ncbi:hypothetical protein KFU94_39385 [Chloroflexi bacterium TSY]|nr:hypothetical protein [Chloroflexi bacterium TSY]
MILINLSDQHLATYHLEVPQDKLPPRITTIAILNEETGSTPTSTQKIDSAGDSFVESIPPYGVVVVEFGK